MRGGSQRNSAAHTYKDDPEMRVRGVGGRRRCRDSPVPTTQNKHYLPGLSERRIEGD